MKSYHTYHGDSQQAETKLIRVQSQRLKVDQQNPITKRFRNYEKESEKVHTPCTSSVLQRRWPKHKIFHHLRLTRILEISYPKYLFFTFRQIIIGRWNGDDKLKRFFIVVSIVC